MSQMDASSMYTTPRGSRFMHVRESGHWFSPGRVIGFLLGAVVAVMGALILMKTGVSSELNTPLTTVFGLTASPAIGLIALAAGLLLILSAASESTRPLMGFVGVLMLVAGLVGTVSSFEIQSDVGFEPATGWFFAVMGLIALVASLIPSVWSQRREYEDEAV
jgi:hypothetical protein